MTAVLVTWAFLVAGCAAPPAAEPTREAPTREAAQQTLHRLAAAVRDGQRHDFMARFLAGDEELRATADRWWANLDALAVTRFELTAGPLDATGTGAVTIDWAIPDETGTATHQARMTFTGGAEPTLSAVAPADPPDRRPLWWADPVTVVRQGRATVAAVAAPADWAARADRAAERVIRAVPESLRRGWSGSVVVEVPATAEGYDRLLGGASGSQAGYAAVAWAEGNADPTSTTGRVAVRVVVNPDIGPLDPRAIDLLLTHEVTHVARYDAASAAPLWVVEGFADRVAYGAQPELRAVAEDNLRATVRSDGAPSALPADDDFRSGTAHELDRAYLLAWSACRSIEDRYGAAALHRFVAAVGSGSDVGPALRSAAGVEPAEFTKAWRQDLVDGARS